MAVNGRYGVVMKFYRNTLISGRIKKPDNPNAVDMNGFMFSSKEGMYIGKPTKLLDNLRDVDDDDELDEFDE